MPWGINKGMDSRGIVLFEGLNRISKIFNVCVCVHICEFSGGEKASKPALR